MHNPNRSVSEFNITLLELSVNRETHCVVDHVSLSFASHCFFKLNVVCDNLLNGIGGQLMSNC